MTWLKTDDKYPEHRKVRRLTDPAYRLHHTAMCACARDETDGRVTEADIEEMEHGRRLRKHVPALVAAGLWEQVSGGWVVHDFLHYNPSHEQSNAKRASDRERQARSRKGKIGTDPTEPPSVTDQSRRDISVTPSGVTRESQPPVPSRPDPSRKDSQSQVPNARAALQAVRDADIGDGWLSDALGLTAQR